MAPRAAEMGRRAAEALPLIPPHRRTDSESEEDDNKDEGGGSELGQGAGGGGTIDALQSRATKMFGVGIVVTLILLLGVAGGSGGEYIMTKHSGGSGGTAGTAHLGRAALNPQGQRTPASGRWAGLTRNRVHPLTYPGDAAPARGRRAQLGGQPGVVAGPKYTSPLSLQL